jgi:hypothetical protein
VTTAPTPKKVLARWRLAIAQHDGRTVTAGATTALDTPSKMLVAIVQAAQRTAYLTGAIERGSFPAALLSASGMITVTIRDGRSVDHGRQPILEGVQRTRARSARRHPASSHDGTEVEVVGVRQIIAGRRWEQVARAYLL